MKCVPFLNIQGFYFQNIDFLFAGIMILTFCLEFTNPAQVCSSSVCTRYTSLLTFTHKLHVNCIDRFQWYLRINIYKTQSWSKYCTIVEGTATENFSEYLSSIKHENSRIQNMTKDGLNQGKREVSIAFISPVTC